MVAISLLTHLCPLTAQPYYLNAAVALALLSFIATVAVLAASAVSANAAIIGLARSQPRSSRSPWGHTLERPSRSGHWWTPV